MSKIEITNEDNMLLMARYPDKYFDLAIVDPPYGLGKSVVNSGGRFKRYENKNGNWDNETPTKEYFNELFRVSKNQIIWGGNYFELPTNKCFIVWDKGQPEGISFSMAEYAWASFDKVAQIFKHRTQGQEQRFHPTQKPIKLYEWLLINYAKDIKCDYCLGSGDMESLTLDCDVQICNKCKGKGFIKPKILDTHLGSGSIAIACHNLGFELTACELDKDYYESALKRLKNHQAQLTMF